MNQLYFFMPIIDELIVFYLLVNDSFKLFYFIIILYKTFKFWI